MRNKVYGIQVLVDNRWEFMCPTGGKPYRYETEFEADSIARMCYPDQLREHRLGGKQTVMVAEFPAS